MRKELAPQKGAVKHQCAERQQDETVDNCCEREFTHRDVVRIVGIRLRREKSSFPPVLRVHFDKNGAKHNLLQRPLEGAVENGVPFVELRSGAHPAGNRWPTAPPQPMDMSNDTHEIVTAGKYVEFAGHLIIPVLHHSPIKVLQVPDLDWSEALPTSR